MLRYVLRYGKTEELCDNIVCFFVAVKYLGITISFGGQMLTDDTLAREHFITHAILDCIIDFRMQSEL